jgi:hypothetical protein
MGSDSDRDEEVTNKKTAKRKADREEGNDDHEMKSESKKGESYSMKYPGVFLREINDRDVLQGRGSGSNLYQGNMIFRDMIDEVAVSYTSTTSRKEKNKLVDELIGVIHERNGRFLHPIDSDEAKRLGLDPNVDFFYEITDSDAVDKVKQAIRYVHYKKRPLMEQRRKEAAERRGHSTIPGAAERLMEARSVSSSINSNADPPTIQQLLQSLSSSIQLGQNGLFPTNAIATVQPFRQTQKAILQQKQIPGPTSSSHTVLATSEASSESASLPVGSPNPQQCQMSERSNLNRDIVMLLQAQQQVQSAAPHNSMLNVLSGLQQPGQNDQGNWQNILQQQLLLEQLQQFQREQEQQRQQHQVLQTLLQMQSGQPFNQNILLSALAASFGHPQARKSSCQTFSQSAQEPSSLMVRHKNPIKTVVLRSRSLSIYRFSISRTL